MINTIIFDAFGTLISTSNSSVDAIAEILKPHKRDDITAFEFYMLFKEIHRSNVNGNNEFITEAESFCRALDTAYKHYGINGNAEKDIEIMLNVLGKRLLFEDTKNAVKTLSDKYTVCIGSNTDTAPLLEILSRNSLLVDKIYTSELLRVYKPNTAFYKAILDDLKILPSEAIFVGDSLTDDVAGPQSVGIKGCHLNRNGIIYRDMKPELSINSLNELDVIISKLNKTE